MVYRTESTAQTEALGRELGARLRPGSVVAFRGGLGMGKTAFTRGLAQGLGCTGRGGVCAVEWSENVADAMPDGTVYVTIQRSPEGENTRKITITGGDAL